jgi:hypothetical protein
LQRRRGEAPREAYRSWPPQRWKQLHAGEDGCPAIEARTQTTDEVEHESLIGHGGPEGAESVRHRLHLTAVLIQREIALNKLAEGGLKV